MNDELYNTCLKRFSKIPKWKKDRGTYYRDAYLEFENHHEFYTFKFKERCKKDKKLLGNNFHGALFGKDSIYTCVHLSHIIPFLEGKFSFLVKEDEECVKLSFKFLWMDHLYNKTGKIFI